MTVSVIIPNWNGMPFLLDCLKALEKQTQKHTVVVVDNGSVDESVMHIKKLYPDIVVIQHATNLGFTGGVNAGLKYSIEHEYTYAALLNNDAVPEIHWLAELVAGMTSDQDIGITTCKLLHTDKVHIDSTGDFYATCGIGFPRGRNTVDKGQYDNDTDVFGASGGASLYRIAMLHKIGLFDNYFFAYFEDIDISFRARLAGWKVAYVPSSVCYHAISKTSNRLGSFSRYHSIKNLPILYIKNMPGWLFWKYLPLFCYKLARQLVSSTVKGLLLVHLKAWGVALVHVPIALSQRRSIQTKRKLSSRQIDQMLWHGKLPKIAPIDPS